MFGLSFMEIVVLLLVGLVVIGPRQLPAMLRTAGRWITKLRRMAFDMREQSGIDDILRNEGLEKDIQQLRALLRKGTVLDALAIDVDAEIARGARRPSRAQGSVSPQDDDVDAWDREYPAAGADAYGLPTEDMDPYQQIATPEEDEDLEGFDDDDDDDDEVDDENLNEGATSETHGSGGKNDRTKA